MIRTKPVTVIEWLLIYTKVRFTPKF